MNPPNTKADFVAANAFFALHWVFSLFVILGAFLLRAHEEWAWIHVPAVLWAFLVNVADWACPLTTWEERFRHRADQSGAQGFIRRYLGPLLNVHGKPRRLEIIIGVSVLLWNVLLYIVILRRSLI